MLKLRPGFSSASARWPLCHVTVCLPRCRAGAALEYPALSILHFQLQQVWTRSSTTCSAAVPPTPPAPRQASTAPTLTGRSSAPVGQMLLQWSALNVVTCKKV